MNSTNAPIRRRLAPAVAVLTIACACGSTDTDTEASGSPVAESSVGDDATAESSVSSTTDAPSTTSAPSTTDAPPTTAMDEGALAWSTIDIVDTTRATDEVRGPGGDVLLAASPTRTIPTEILYPGLDGGGEGAAAATASADRPLVVWLNGLGGRATPGDPLLLSLYEAGYIVAAPNVREIAAPVSFGGGHLYQPGDVSAVIDALTAPDDGVFDDLAPIIDTDRIGAAGHSIGGSGVYGVAFHDCCRDDRISAAAVFAPPRIDLEGGEFRFSGLPLLIVHGTADQIIGLDQSEAVHADADDALLVSVLDADHFQTVYGDERPEVLSISEELLTTFFDVHLAGVAEVDELEGVFAKHADAVTVR